MAHLEVVRACRIGMWRWRHLAVGVGRCRRAEGGLGSAANASRPVRWQCTIERCSGRRILQLCFRIGSLASYVLDRKASRHLPVLADLLQPDTQNELLSPFLYTSYRTGLLFPYCQHDTSRTVTQLTADRQACQVAFNAGGPSNAAEQPSPCGIFMPPIGGAGRGFGVGGAVSRGTAAAGLPGVGAIGGGALQALEPAPVARGQLLPIHRKGWRLLITLHTQRMPFFEQHTGYEATMT